MRKIILNGLCVIGLSISSCTKDSKTNTFHGYFQYSYVNYTWTTNNTGWIIDKSGNVKSYKNPQKWNLTDSLGYITEQQLIDNLSYCDSIINTISSSNLTNYNSLIESVSKGQMTIGKQGGADMGTMTYYCYWYDETKGKYKQILLSQTGDWIVSNTGNSAIRIDTWLKTIVHK